MTYIAIIVLFFADHFPEDDQKRLKLGGELPHGCTLL
jgi:hypothetical protein